MGNTNEKRLAFLGGDPRQLTAAATLRERGYECVLYGFGGMPHAHTGTVDAACCSDAWNPPADFAGQLTRAGRLCETAEEAIAGSDAVILPLPASGDGVHAAMPCAPQGYPPLSLTKIAELMHAHRVKLLCGGKLSGTFCAMCESLGIRTADYYEREEFAVANAIPTAEGAAAIAMNALPVTLHGASLLVIGFGRIGKVLARLLRSFGAHVTVSARKAADFAWIDAEGFEGVHTAHLAEVFAAGTFDGIFNTVPHTVLGGKELARIPEQTLIVDLASKPGGVDMSAAAGHSVIWALSLPGKVAPATSGKIIADTLEGMLSEEGLC